MLKQQLKTYCLTLNTDTSTDSCAYSYPFVPALWGTEGYRTGFICGKKTICAFVAKLFCDE